MFPSLHITDISLPEDGSGFPQKEIGSISALREYLLLRVEEKLMTLIISTAEKAELVLSINGEFGVVSHSNDESEVPLYATTQRYVAPFPMWFHCEGLPSPVWPANIVSASDAVALVLDLVQAGSTGGDIRWEPMVQGIVKHCDVSFCRITEDGVQRDISEIYFPEQAEALLQTLDPDDSPDYGFPGICLEDNTSRLRLALCNQGGVVQFELFSGWCEPNVVETLVSQGDQSQTHPLAVNWPNHCWICASNVIPRNVLEQVLVDWFKADGPSEAVRWTRSVA
jgi:hypothetical protein